MKNTVCALLLVALSLGWAPLEAQPPGFLDNPKAAVFAAYEKLAKEHPKGKAPVITRVEITPRRVNFEVQNARNAEEIVSLSYNSEGGLDPLPGTEETMPEIIQARSFTLQEIDWDAVLPFLKEAVRQSKLPGGTIISFTVWRDHWPASEELILHASLGGEPEGGGFARADAKGKILTVSSTVLKK